MTILVDIRSVLDALGSQRAVSGELPLGEIALGDETFAFPEPARFDVTLTYTGAGIVASGQVRGVARTTCVRCLCEFVLAVTGDVEGFYVEPGRDTDIPEEQEHEPVRDGRVDLEPALRQAIAVELPFAPVHADDCAGICASCGADLNEGACGCLPDAADSPFAKLKGLLREGTPSPEAPGGSRGLPGDSGEPPDVG